MTLQFVFFNRSASVVCVTFYVLFLRNEVVINSLGTITNFTVFKFILFSVFDVAVCFFFNRSASVVCVTFYVLFLRNEVVIDNI